MKDVADVLLLIVKRNFLVDCEKISKIFFLFDVQLRIEVIVMLDC
jgi:hypothetical protein